MANFKAILLFLGIKCKCVSFIAVKAKNDDID